ncbi:unnamed protein product [Peronospora belbahrii]|uniref:LicD/FKTN/FKRP nucleotidyltransferase domain-containing protein n=1 Tax=Peronospora belbahrii TaxID=622444 RepID=A0ABN8D3D0_9STRA|nr:unnamed protein product [Peronospora belbahrii]
MLENAQIVYWIDSGTLLGVYRARELVPWDYNVDIGITMTGFDLIQSTTTTNKILEIPEGYEVTVLNSSLYDTGETSTAVPMKVIDRKFGFYANVFVFKEFDGLFHDHLRPATASMEETNIDDVEDIVGNGVIVEKLIGPEPSNMWHRCIYCPVVGEEDGINMSGEASNATVVKRFHIPREWVFPLRVCKVELFEVMCPAQITPYLMYIFGNRFLTPQLWE